MFDIAELELTDPEAAFWDLAHEEAQPIGALDAPAAVDAMVAWYRRQSRDAAQLLRVLARFGELRAGEGLEFAGDEVAAALRLSVKAATALLDLAMALTRRLPATLAALEAGEIDITKARALAEIVRPLSGEQASAVERQVLVCAPGQTVGQLRAAAQRAVLRLDPDGAERRHTARRAERRVELHPLPDGMAELSALLPAEAAVALYRRIDALARTGAALGDPCGVDARRADALADLGGPKCPCGAGPRGGDGVALRVIVGAGTLLGLDDHPAELAGYGPIRAELARELAADATWRRVLTDPETGALLDVGTTSYRAPTGLARHVKTRDGTCRFPGCRQPASRCDLDHVVPFPEGATKVTNLQSLCRHHHRLKTEAEWSVTEGDDGTVMWTSPTGHTYVTTPPPQDLRRER